MQVLHTFAFAGSNRRSRLPIIEQHVRFDTRELAIFDERPAAFASRLEALLDETLGGGRPAPDAQPPDSQMAPEVRCGNLYAAAAVALQNAARHIVRESGADAGSEPGCCRAYFEYEENDTAHAAADLARAAVQALLDAGTAGAETPGLDHESLAGLREQTGRFLDEAVPRAMPHDGRAIFEAALDRDIPCFRMDRPPYRPIQGDFRIRHNALFRLGHGHCQHTVDGTFCVDLSQPAHALVRDRRKLFRKLEALGVPLPSGRQPSRFCLSPGRASRVAAQHGFPAAVRPALRAHGRGVALNLEDADAVRRAAETALQVSDQALVEPHVPGRTYRLLLAGCRPLTVLEKPGDSGEWRPRDLGRLHPSLPQLGERIATAFNAGLVAVTFVTPDAARALEDVGGAVVDVDLAPRLDRLFAPDDPLLHETAGAFVDWMLPDPAEARIPVIAITGTNGKTTTCRLVARIMECAGYRTGLACSDGTYIRGRRISQYEDGYLPGHLTVLDNPEVDLAVLESALGGALSAGLGFNWCNAAACLNVTPDHLDDAMERSTVDDLAEIKGWIVERTQEVAVLNADDNRCLSMQSRLPGRRIGLASLHGDGAWLRERAGPGGVACVEESIGDENWIVLYGNRGRKPVMPVGEMPVAFGGRARHNVSNALHAAALCHLMGIGADTIARGLADLEGSFEALPGRLTFFHELPFDVVMDYAHNPDGMRHMCQFADQVPVEGRRILALSCAAYNHDDFIRDTARAAAGHFDHYVCKNFGNLFERQPEEGPQLLRDGLLAGGVAPGDITCIPDEFEAIDAAMGMAREGDLVVILAGKRKQQIWDWINSFGERHGIQRRASNSVGQRSPSS